MGWKRFVRVRRSRDLGPTSSDARTLFGSSRLGLSEVLPDVFTFRGFMKHQPISVKEPLYLRPVAKLLENGYQGR